MLLSKEPFKLKELKSKFSWQSLQHTLQTSMHLDKSISGTQERAKNQYKIIADNADYQRITIYMNGDFAVDRSNKGDHA